MRLAVLLIILLFAPLAARAAEPIAAVPYRVDYGGWFTIEVTVNGEGPFDFVIDTGATRTLVFENLAALQNYQLSGGPPHTVLGLASAGEFPTYFVGDVAVGAARLDNLITVVLPDWRANMRAPHGVLGLDFLSRYQVVFDAGEREIRFYELATAPSLSGWDTVKLTADDFGVEAGLLYTLDGRINRRKARFLLDLGATGTIINGRTYRASSPGGMRVTLQPSSTATRITDALEKKGAAKPVRVEKFRVGRTNWYKQIFTVYDAPIFEELGVEHSFFGLFGANLLYNRSFALDFPNGRLLIGPVAR